MKKQQNNWLHFLIIISIILLPFQYGMASSTNQMMMGGFKCQDHQSHHQAHDNNHHDKQLSSSASKVCDSEQNCTDHQHCAKCNMDKQVISHSIIQHPSSNKISYLSSSFFEFYPHPDLRPPQA